MNRFLPITMAGLLTASVVAVPVFAHNKGTDDGEHAKARASVTGDAYGHAATGATVEHEDDGVIVHLPKLGVTAQAASHSKVHEDGVIDNTQKAKVDGQNENATAEAQAESENNPEENKAEIGAKVKAEVSGNTGMQAEVQNFLQQLRTWLSDLGAQLGIHFNVEGNANAQAGAQGEAGSGQ